jgi:ribosome maturation factor RimP
MDRSSLSYREKIIELVEPVVESGEMELIDVECFRGKSCWMVRIYIDKESGVGLDNCAMISGEIGDLLDINETPPGAYDLEVSSPGLDRPLARDKDFIKYTGHTVKISVAEKIEKKRNFRGRLVDFVEKDGEKVLVVDVEGKIYNIPRNIVVKANLQYEF